MLKPKLLNLRSQGITKKVTEHKGDRKKRGEPL
jgi:hypothetical protein